MKSKRAKAPARSKPAVRPLSASAQSQMFTTRLPREVIRRLTIYARFTDQTVMEVVGRMLDKHLPRLPAAWGRIGRR